MNLPTTLLVEDNLDTAEILVLSLQKSGYHVAHSESCARVSARFKRRRGHCISYVGDETWQSPRNGDDALKVSSTKK
jgi:hypothetical protein